MCLPLLMTAKSTMGSCLYVGFRMVSSEKPSNCWCGPSASPQTTKYSATLLSSISNGYQLYVKSFISSYVWQHFSYNHRWVATCLSVFYPGDVCSDTSLSGNIWINRNTQSLNSQLVTGSQTYLLYEWNWMNYKICNYLPNRHLYFLNSSNMLMTLRNIDHNKLIVYMCVFTCVYTVPLNSWQINKLSVLNIIAIPDKTVSQQQTLLNYDTNWAVILHLPDTNNSMILAHTVSTPE